MLVPLLTACPKGDIGAPCNHGDVQPPDSKVVTFPALSCNDLLCVYADESKPPGSCQNDEQCNMADAEKSRFLCDSGTCKLSASYVLERSMCSRTCATDADCEDGGIGKKVLASETECTGGFRCAQLQKLGEFCCRSMCVCSDDLNEGALDTLRQECDKLDKDADGQPICDDMDMMPVEPPAEDL